MITLRNATYEDCDLLFRWANDESVRKNSFNSEDICIETHRTWLKNKLQDENSQLYIILKDNCDVGVIRIDKNNEDYTISYSISKEYRGKGLGKEVLIYIKDNIKDKRLIGLVKPDNIISIKAFEGAGYNKFIENDYIKFTSV